MSSVFNVTEHIIAASHIREYPRATANSQDEELRLHVKQYTPKDNPHPRKGDLTVIGAHANGFPKELYEPLWDDFYHEASKLGIRIRSIWIADAAWQGRSGVLNQGKLGNDPSWHDYARDIVHMINTLRMPRPILAVGHSFGGNVLTNVALLHPRLFSGLVLLDPVISNFDPAAGSLFRGPAVLSARRRHVWPSRGAAAEAFRRNPYYRSWDPRVLDRWVRYGLRGAERAVDGREPKQQRQQQEDEKEKEEEEEGEVTLTTTRDQEVFTYLRPSWPAYDAQGTSLTNRAAAPELVPSTAPDSGDERRSTWPFYRPEGPDTMRRLPHVRPATLWVLGGRSETNDARFCVDRVARTGTGAGGSGGLAAGRVREVTFAECGHLVPMEAPRACAREAAAWAKGEVDRWRDEEREFEVWAASAPREKVTLSDEFKKYLGEPGDKTKSKI